MWKNIKKFSFFWIFLILFKFGAGIHYTLMSPFGEKILPIWLVGIIIGAASLIQLILDVPAGLLLDKLGYRKMLKVTTLLFILAASFLLFDLNIYTYVFTLFAGSLGWLFFGPGVNAYVLSHSPKNEEGVFISYRDVFESLGIVLVSMIFIYMLSLPIQYAAIIILVILIFAYIFISFSPKDIYKIHEKEKIPNQGYYIRKNYISRVVKIVNKLNPASLILLFFGFSSSVFYAMIWFVVPLMVMKTESKMMALGMGVFDLTVVLTGFLLGKLADKLNRKTLVFFGLLIFSVSGMLLGFNFGFVFILLGFIATTGDEMASVSLWSWLNILDKNHDEDGLISGIINLSQDLGWTVGPIMAGILYSLIGPAWTIMIGGIFVFVVWITYSFFVMRKEILPFLENVYIPRKPHKFRHKR